MVIPTYDQTSPKSIESFGRRLLKSTLRNTLGVNEIPEQYLVDTPGTKTKGIFGTIIEKFYYGINPGNQPCSPDFKEAGVELKTNAIIKKRKGFSAKERLVLQMINYHDIINESFESSCFMAKSRLMMLISNSFQKDGSIVDAKIELAMLIDFNQLAEKDQHIIREDWEIIANKIRKGLAHQLSGSDTTYLEACTKGSNGGQRVSQPASVELAKPRALAFKSGFVSGIIQGSLKDDEQPAITDNSLLERDGFEAAVLDRFSPFIGLTVKEIETKLGKQLNETAKGYRATLSRFMLGISTRKIAEFESAGIELKTMLIHENGLLKEHISFPAFRYMGEGSILEEEWDAVDENDDEDVGTLRTPDIKYRLESTKFLFIIFTKENGVERLGNVRFWSMEKPDIEEYVKPVWSRTYEAVNTGNLGNIPKIAFNHVCHVRPHAANKMDTYPTPHNGSQTKKSFWLDKRYIQSQISS